MTDEIVDDVMPAVPAEGEALPAEGAMSAALFDEVPGMGEAIPVGTFHFRLESRTKGWSDPDPKKPEEGQFGKQPWYMINWSCQQEPHTGRSTTEFVPWCNKETFDKAASGDKTAQKIVKNRLYVIKDILAACSYKPVGEFLIEPFLDSNPECKIQLGLKAGNTDSGKTDPGTGKKIYIPDGSMRNKVIKHVSLTRPA